MTEKKRRFLTTFGMTGKTKNKRIPHCVWNDLRNKDKIALVEAIRMARG
jgi:hypothetical protein